MTAASSSERKDAAPYTLRNRLSIGIAIGGVGFAQGHTLGANNWWFGGQTCARESGDDVVRCQATRGSNGQAYNIWFLRGGSQTLQNNVDWVTIVGMGPV